MSHFCSATQIWRNFARISLSFRDLTRDRLRTDRQTDNKQTRRPFHKALTLTVCELNNWDSERSGFFCFLSQYVDRYKSAYITSISVRLGGQHYGCDVLRRAVRFRRLRLVPFRSWLLNVDFRIQKLKTCLTSTKSILKHRINKKSVISQWWPRDAPAEVNKHPRDSRLTQFNRTLWT